MNYNKVVIIGASSAIAMECARLWAEKSPKEIILVGRNREKLEIIEEDLKVRAPETTITSIETDFVDPIAIEELANTLCKKNVVDIVLIAHGMLPSQQLCQDNLKECRQALEINGLSPVLFAEAFVKHMTKVDKGRIAIIGSVAGDRGRKSNYVYGAAKDLVSRYAQGLQHRLAKTNVKIILIKPGPTDTPMTAQLKESGGKLASSKDVAKDIVLGVSNGNTLVYTPRKWSLIMMIIRHLPTFVFNEINI